MRSETSITRFHPGLWMSALMMFAFMLSGVACASGGTVSLFPTPVETDACCLNEAPGLELTLAAEALTPQNTREVTSTTAASQTATPAPSSTPIPLQPSGDWSINSQNVTGLEKLVEVKPALIGVPNDIAWSPDGTLLAATGAGGLVLLNGETLEAARTLETAGIFTRLTFSADGRYLAASGQSSGLSQVWEVGSGRHVHTITNTGGLSAISPDGKILAIIEDNPQYPESGEKYQEVILRRFNLLTGDLIGETRGKTTVAWWTEFIPETIGMVFSPDSLTIQSVNSLGDVFLWNSADGRIMNTSINSPTRQRLSFGNCIVDDAGRSGFGVLCRITYNDPPCTEDDVNCIFEVKGRYELGLWDTGRLNRLSNLIIKDPDAYYKQILVDSPSKLALLAGGNRLDIWKFGHSEKPSKVIEGETLPEWVLNWQRCETCPVPLMAVKPGSESSVLAVSHHGRIVLWDYRTNQILAGLDHDVQSVTSAAFGALRAAPVLAAGFSDGSLEVLNLVDRHIDARMGKPASPAVLHVALAPDDKTLITADEVSLNWYSMDEGTLIRQEKFGKNDIFNAHPESGLLIAGVSKLNDEGYYRGADLFARDIVTGDARWSIPVFGSKAGISPDGQWLVTLESDSFHLFDLNDGRLVLSQALNRADKSTRSVGISPGGGLTAVSFYDGTLQLLDANTGNVKFESTFQPGIYQMAFHPAGCLLAAGDGNGVIHILDIDSNQVISYFNAHTAAINSLGFNSSGSLLLSTGMDGAARVWGQAGAQELMLPGFSGQSCRYGDTPHAVTPTVPLPTQVVTAAASTSEIKKLARSLKLTAPRMTGEDVRHLQQRLSKLGFTRVGTPDGIFGPNTNLAVRQYQEKNGLEADGIVGPITWEQLFKNTP